MKTKRQRVIVSGLVAGSLLVCNTSTQAANLTWTGASPSGSLLWSDADNWTPAASPGYDLINFIDLGPTNAPGVPNNIVGADITVSNLNYRAVASAVTGVSNYHTTVINPGVTLTVDRGTVGSSLIYVGHTTDPGNSDAQYYYTIKGPGAKLVAGNLSEPLATQGLQVTGVQRSGSAHFGSLDMSELDSFSMAGGYFWAGINGGEGTAATDRPAGQVLLARTNLVVMVGNTYDGLNLGSFRIGESRGNTPSRPSTLELGQENSFYTPWLKIGGARTGTQPGQGGLMYFRDGLENPTLKLRGSDGESRLGTMRIGDNSWSSSGSIGSRGEVDLSGGKVDAYINEMYVGRGPGGNSATAPTATSFATGTLTWTDGTFDVLTLLVGYQFGNNPSTNYGALNVLTPNARLIADRLVLGRDAGGNSGGGTGLLNIDGGTVEITTYLSESPGTGGNAAGTVILTNNGVLNLQPEGDLNPAAATISTLEYSSGTFTNGVLAVKQINVNTPATEFVVHPKTELNAGIVGAVGALSVNGNLRMAGGVINADVTDFATLDQISVTGNLALEGMNSVEINPLSPIPAGTYPLMTYGSLSGSAANLQVAGPLADSRYTVTFDTAAQAMNMVVSGTPKSLIWSGGKSANAWDLKNTANWNAGADQFYAFDSVQFDDTGSASPAIDLQGDLAPGGVTFSASAKDYTLAGPGKISGVFGLTLNGSSTVTLLTTNNYKGATEIYNGTLVLGDGANADGSLGTGTVINNGTLVFNPAATQTVSPVIEGSGAVIKRGPGRTRLAAANTFTGLLTVEAGTLQAGNASALGDLASVATINNGATLDLGGFTLAKPLMVAGAGVAGGGAIINTGSAQSLRDVQLSGDTVFGGSAAWTIGSSAAGSADPGLTAYGYKITKVSTNLVRVNGLRSLAWALDLGEVEVKEGVFALSGNLSLGTQTGKPITVRPGATLEIGVNPDQVLTRPFVFNDSSCLFVQGTNSVMDGSVVLGGTVVFDVLNTRALFLECPVTGGTLVKGIGTHPATATSTGNGTLVLSGANSVTGFRVETGTVVLTNSATVSAAELILAGGTLSAAGRTDGTLALNNGQSLKGKGTVIGIVTSPAGTTVAPAETNGLIAVTGDITLRGTTAIDLNRTGSVVTNSMLTASGTLDCGGALVLTSSGEPLRAGDTFKLFTAPTVLNPFEGAAITWPALASGLYWTNLLAVDGTIAVAASEPAEPPSLSANISGTQLTLRWPAAYTSYVLQAQTNTIAVGLSGNWFNVPGVSGNEVIIGIDAANPCVFYRLIKP